MSQCHDIYGPVWDMGSGASLHRRGLEGAQCHDVTRPSAYPADRAVMPYLQDRQGAPGPGQQAAPAGRGGRYGLGARGWLGGAVRPGGADVVKVRGRVDWRARLTMEEVMRHTAERAVIVDLSATEPDFHGRKEVVVFLARARQRGRRAIVVSPDPALYMSLLGHGLRPIIPVVSSEPEAVRWLVRHPWRG